MFELHILGTNSAMPAFGRHPTAQMLTHQGVSFLLDCGEGTQMQAGRYRIRLRKLDTILITHMHGDHVMGLPGIVTSLSLGGREHPLTIVGPIGIRDFVETSVRLTYSTLRYPVTYIELPIDTPAGHVVLDTERLTVTALPLSHRIPTFGYLFTEKPRKHRFLFHTAKSLGVPKEKMGLLKLGNAITLADGTQVVPEQVLAPPNRPRSYAFCTDTAFIPELADWVQGVDVLYHEATFLDDQEARAAETFHSTAKQAAWIAQKAGAGQLLIGHYSARYKSLEPFLEEARKFFLRTSLAIEGESFQIPHREPQG